MITIKEQRVGFRHINYINKELKRKCHMALSAKLNSVLCLRHVELSDVKGCADTTARWREENIGYQPQQQK